MNKEDITKSINELVDEAWSRMQLEMETKLQPEVLVETVEKSEDAKEKKEEMKKDEKAPKKDEDKKEEEKKVEKSEEASEEDKEDEESVEKGKAEQEAKNLNANGGKDEIKSGSPKTEEQPMMRKSEAELASMLTEDELEVIKAWREEIGAEVSASEEVIVKSQGGLTDLSSLTATIKEAVESATSDFRKSLSDKDELIKSMNERIEKMASAPAYDKRSVDSLEVIEKSQGDAPALTKSQVLNTMLDLQKAGKGVSSIHVAEFEATGNISNQTIANLVKNACK